MRRIQTGDGRNFASPKKALVNISPRPSCVTATTSCAVAFPLHPVVQCCEPKGGAPTCEISAVRTSPLVAWAQNERVNIEVWGPGVLPDVGHHRQSSVSYFTCEISSVTSHPAEGRSSREMAIVKTGVWATRVIDKHGGAGRPLAGRWPAAGRPLAGHQWPANGWPLAGQRSRSLWRARSTDYSIHSSHTVVTQ